jgi:SOS-response transcriptional repressor LexA
MALTPHRMLGYRASQVRAYLLSEIASCGVAPSYSMICNETGISTRGEVSRIVAALERRGEIKRVGPTRVSFVRARRERCISMVLSANS